MEQVIVRCRWRRKWQLSEGFQLHNNTTFIRPFDPKQQREVKHGGNRWSSAPAGLLQRPRSVMLNAERRLAVTNIMSNNCYDCYLFIYMKDKLRERGTSPGSKTNAPCADNQLPANLI